MKRIQLLRHAKSSWDNPDLDDIDRPLNKRGKRACKIMAERLLSAGCSFDFVVSSPAKRARRTIKRIARHLPDINVDWQIDDRLYTFDSDELLHYLRTLDEQICEPLIVGHNPALTELCNYLTASEIDNIPTCAYVSLRYAGETWQQLEHGCCQLENFIKPSNQ